MDDATVLTIRDIDELNYLAEEVLMNPKNYEDIPVAVDNLNFEENEKLHVFTFQAARELSLEEIRWSYLFNIIPIARDICRRDPQGLYGEIVGESVDDEYLDDLLAFRWKENLKRWAKLWDRQRKRMSRTTTLEFNFNQEAVKMAGLTTDELLEDMRRYAKECEVEEIAYGVFSKSGDDALAILMGYVVRKNDDEPDFVNYLDSWIADVEGNIEDCKKSIERHRNKWD